MTLCNTHIKGTKVDTSKTCVTKKCDFKNVAAKAANKAQYKFTHTVMNLEIIPGFSNL